MARTFALALVISLNIGWISTASASWRPDLDAARAYILKRPGGVSFSISESDRNWGYRGKRQVPAASLMKTMFMAAYLGRIGHRPLKASDKQLLYPMVTRSENFTATRIRNLVGDQAIYRVARGVGMTDFKMAKIWGLSLTSSRDQVRLYKRLNRVLPSRHRAYAYGLLSSITRSQRWGIAQAKPAGWKLYFKGGWGSGTGLVDHQSALLVKGSRRLAISITTANNGSHANGKETLHGVAVRLLRGLN